MLKLMSAVAIAFAVVLAGCASQQAGAGASGIDGTSKTPFPGYYNKWNPPA